MRVFIKTFKADKISAGEFEKLGNLNYGLI